MQFSLVDATCADAGAIAALHADSWRHAYRGILPEAFLTHDVEQNRRALWEERMATASAAMCVLKAVTADDVVGFACVFLNHDSRWGALLDNLHVRPGLTGRGVGAALLAAARTRVIAATADPRMYLWVFEANTRARHFYERHGGVAVEHQLGEVLPGVFVPELRFRLSALEI